MRHQVPPYPASAPGPIQVEVVGKAIPAWGMGRLIESGRPRVALAGVRHALELEAGDATRPRVDVVVLELDDFSHPDPVTELRRYGDAKILVISGGEDHGPRDRAILSGARGVIDKDDTPEALLAAIEKVHAGEMCMDPRTTSRIVSLLTQHTAPVPMTSEQRRIASLSPRERHTVAALASSSGATGKQLAETLHISEHTLRKRLSGIYAKLGVSNRVALFAFAQRNGLVRA